MIPSSLRCGIPDAPSGGDGAGGGGAGGGGDMCPSGFAACSGSCVDEETDGASCGACADVPAAMRTTARSSLAVASGSDGRLYACSRTLAIVPTVPVLSDAHCA